MNREEKEVRRHRCVAYQSRACIPGSGGCPDRVTPRLYNDDADVDRLFGVLERAL
jgi:selenocysteine lyase/cysteine desulfurase